MIKWIKIGLQKSTHLSFDLFKQHRRSSEAAERDICLGSELFAHRTYI